MRIKISKVNTKNINLEKDLEDKEVDIVTSDSEAVSDSELESDIESEKDFKLKINNTSKIDDELNVQNIDDDPDKLDLGVLDLKTELSDDEGISLDIEELK